MKSDDQKNETLTDKHEKKGRHGKGRLKIIPDLPRDGGSQKSHFKNVLWWLDQTLTFSFLSSDTGEGRTTSYWWWCSSTSEKIQGRERWRESVWKRYYWKILWSSVALCQITSLSAYALHPTFSRHLKIETSDSLGDAVCHRSNLTPVRKVAWLMVHSWIRKWAPCHHLKSFFLLLKFNF